MSGLQNACQIAFQDYRESFSCLFEGVPQGRRSVRILSSPPLGMGFCRHTSFSPAFRIFFYTYECLYAPAVSFSRHLSAFAFLRVAKAFLIVPLSRDVSTDVRPVLLRFKSYRLGNACFQQDASLGRAVCQARPLWVESAEAPYIEFRQHWFQPFAGLVQLTEVKDHKPPGLT